jgi:apolipoprotein N-acyltransferase
MLACGGPRARIPALLALIVPWAAGAALYHHSWTHASGPAVSVAVVQGAIPQDEKWLESNRETTLQLYRTLTERVLGHALIVWPESAPADVANDIAPYINSLYRDARAHGSAMIMGVLRAEQSPDGGTRYFNSVLALDARQFNWYDKHHLVPFAEFFPVPHFVRRWMRLMSLPYSDFTRGAADQPPLPAAHLQLGTTVCYEDAYGSSMLQVLPRADALVNVTNDAWFGHSSARYQHLQIARMRALEEGRFLVRAANDGISAIIGPHGEVVARAPEFRPVVLVSRVTPMAGLTPYAHVGNWLTVALAALALACGIGVRNDRLWRTRSGSASTVA